MKCSYVILLLSVCLSVKGQNMVPNHDFEDYGTLPCSWITSQSGFSNAMDVWEMPTGGSTDIFSMLVHPSCYAHCQSTYVNRVGDQLPRSGNVMSAILTYGSGCSIPYREYLEVKLTSPLIPGLTYYAEMYVSHGDYSQFASNNLGMYFSNSYVNDPSLCGVLNFVPQINETNVITDSTNWVKISGSFVATSPAEYLIIGNFYDNNSTTQIFCSPFSSGNARYFVDDVLVMQSSAPPLPVELISFTAKNYGDINILYWSTATEKNNDYFTIERSRNGINFTGIGLVNGAGNSVRTNHYYFNDNKPLSGVNYYRLRQTDFDGQYSFSEIVSVNNKRSDEEEIIINPNPVKDFLVINSIKEMGKLNIYNIIGKFVKYELINSKICEININELETGIYFIEVNGMRRKFMKE